MLVDFTTVASFRFSLPFQFSAALLPGNGLAMTRVNHEKLDTRPKENPTQQKLYTKQNIETIVRMGLMRHPIALGHESISTCAVDVPQQESKIHSSHQVRASKTQQHEEDAAQTRTQ